MYWKLPETKTNVPQLSPRRKAITLAQAAVRDHLFPATPLDVTGPEDGKIPGFLEVYHIRPSPKA